MSKIYARKFNETHMIVESDDEVEYELSEYFKFFIPTAKFTPKFKSGFWDGYISLFDKSRKTLYTGLFNPLKEFSDLRGYDLIYDQEEFGHEYSKDYITEWLDKQVITDGEDDITIRDYQFNAVLESIYNKRQLIQSPTSSGKSLILYLFTKFFIEHGKNILVMTDSTNLVDQLYTDWINYSFKNDFDIDKVQRIYAVASKAVSKPIVISTWQSQHSTKKKVNTSHFNDFYDVVLVDEAHKGEANSIMNIMEQCTDIKYRIGLTGSLKKAKLNQLTLEGLFGEKYRTITTRELIDRGEIADIAIKMVMISYGKEIEKHVKKAKYEVQKDWLITLPERIKFISHLAGTLSGNTLILFERIEHGKAILNMVQELYPDIPVYYIDGNVLKDRRNIIRGLIEKEEKSITIGSGGCVATGWSVKNIHNLITSESLKSIIRVLQSIGRVLRKSKTKSKCTYYDICDIPVSTGRRNYFKKHAAERAEIYLEEQLKVKTLKVEL